MTELILTQAKAQAVYRAMCELNNIGALINVRIAMGTNSHAVVLEDLMSDEVRVSVHSGGKVQTFETYPDQESFRSAYSVE